MSRTLSPRAIAAANASETEEVWLVCVTIRHPQITGEGGAPAGALYVVNDYADLTRTIKVGGVDTAVTFVGFPFQIVLPDDDPERPVRAQLQLDNVDQRIIQAVRGLTSPPKADIEVVLASSPNTVEVAFYDLTMRAAEFDSLYVKSDLTIEQIFVEPVGEQMTPQRFPGMF